MYGQCRSRSSSALECNAWTVLSFLFSVYSTGCMERGEGVFTSLVYFTWDGGEDSARSLESLVCSGLLGYVDLGIVFTGKVWSSIY